MMYEKHHSHSMSDSKEDDYCPLHLGAHSFSGVACDQLLLEGPLLACLS